MQISKSIIVLTLYVSLHGLTPYSTFHAFIGKEGDQTEWRTGPQQAAMMFSVLASHLANKDPCEGEQVMYSVFPTVHQLTFARVLPGILRQLTSSQYPHVLFGLGVCVGPPEDVLGNHFISVAIEGSPTFDAQSVKVFIEYIDMQYYYI